MNALLPATLFYGLLLTATAASADVQKVGADGTVHRLAVETLMSGNKTNGTVLRHTRQFSDGTKVSAYVSGTLDAAIERDVTLEVDPVSEEPVIAWSRNDGTGFDLFMSRFENGAWRLPVLVFRGGGDDVESQVRIDRRLVHIVWQHQDGSFLVLYRQSFDRGSLAPVYGPEPLTAEGVYQIPLTDESVGDSPEPSAECSFFAAELPKRSPDEPGRFAMYGVRDVPVPVDYRQILVMPPTMKEHGRAKARFVSKRFVFYLVSGGRLYYSMRVDGRWSDVRIIELTDGLLASDAELHIEELIQRWEYSSAN